MYGDMTTDALTALRDRLRASLVDRLTAPTAAGGAGRSAQYLQKPSDIRQELQTVQRELDRRTNGCGSGGPIYLVG